MSRCEAGPAERDALRTLDSIPRDVDGPVFEAPWQARAFAMAVQLNAAGAFAWSEWAELLGRELAERAGEAQGSDWGETYYLAWLATLERMVERKKLGTAGLLAERRAAWAEAARHTPHGAPIVLLAPAGSDVSDRNDG